MLLNNTKARKNDSQLCGYQSASTQSQIVVENHEERRNKGVIHLIIQKNQFLCASETISTSLNFTSSIEL